MTDYRSGRTQFVQKNDHIRMNLLVFRPFGKHEQRNRDAVFDHGTKAAGMVCVQVRQNDRIRSQSV